MYPQDKAKYLVDRFCYGFDIKYCGPKKVHRTANNLILRVGSKTELWNKVMMEVKDGRYTGPFTEIPFKYYIQSPIGLVPKDTGKMMRLIFHLSYPKGTDESVNVGIPYEFCKVKYPDFEDAVRLCIEAGCYCVIAKSDMARAFRNVPLKKSVWRYLILKAEHPISKKIYILWRNASHLEVLYLVRFSRTS